MNRKTGTSFQMNRKIEISFQMNRKIGTSFPAQHHPLREIEAGDMCCCNGTTTETNRMHLVLFSMQNRIIGLCVTAIHRIGIAAMVGQLSIGCIPFF
jgi:hypothetical protein